jgi:hypothetical protein
MMNDASAVRFVDGIGDLNRILERLIEWQRAALLQALLQRLAFEMRATAS